VRLPVDEPRIERDAATAAHTQSNALERIAVPAAAIPGTATLDLSLAASALGGARPAFDYVVEYPYGCLEQLASRLVVLVTARELFQPSGTDSTQALLSIERTIDAIETASPPWGGYSFWRGGPQPEPWLTAYVAFALSHAAKAGFGVDANVLQNAQFQVTQAWRAGREQARPETPRGDSAAAAARQAEKLWWLQQPAGLGLLALSELVRPEPQSVLEPADVDFIVDHARDLSEDERFFLALALDNWKLRPDFVERVFEDATQRLQVTGSGATLPAPEFSCWPKPFRTGRATPVWRCGLQAGFALATRWCCGWRAGCSACVPAGTGTRPRTMHWRSWRWRRTAIASSVRRATSMPRFTGRGSRRRFWPSPHRRERSNARHVL
jgi:hypothetical protein